MKKRKLQRARKMKQQRSNVKITSQKEVNILEEAKYIIKCAMDGISKLVSLGPLIFISTYNGEAWILEPKDNLALCLVNRFRIQPYNIKETKDSLAIEWTSNFQVDTEKFTIFKDGKASMFFDFPVEEFQHAIKLLHR